MILDYFENTGYYALRVPRGAQDVSALMQEYGLDLSTSASTGDTAVLISQQPFAVADFAPLATPSAYAAMKPMLDRIAQSWAPSSDLTLTWQPPTGKDLWPFQRANLSYALQRKHTLIGDQPGLGKTEVAIGFANEVKARSVLVICPANIRRQWCERIREWSTMTDGYLVHPIFNGRRGVNTEWPSDHWHVVSYDLARTLHIGAQLASIHWDVLVLDEAHYLKSIDALRTRAIFGGGHKRSFEPIAARAERIIALTGTPLPNRPREAYTLARALCFDAIDWMSEDSFKERFNPSMMIEGTRKDGSTFRRVDERSGRHAELQARLRANFMTRHLKREVMPQLKLPIYDLIQLEMTAAVKAALHAESLLEIDPEMLEGADAPVFGDVATVRREMGVAMAPQVADYIDMLIDGGEEKLVVFFHHHEVGDILERAWQDHGVVRIDGRTSAGGRDRRKAQFINDPRCQIFLGQTIATGIGTDELQHVASHGLIAEPDWTPGVNQQAIDRLDRGGQRHQVQADIFVVPGSFAERVLAAALRKFAVTDMALDKRTSW